ncbi:DUF6183 family protein [Deinococcus multiflagellatus]|nr:DUF6183 family protein [Deinococcus multiflagellatus]MBZ9713831.1 DUF6183 family protein [Deinococcus multiflagellatus]
MTTDVAFLLKEYSGLSWPDPRAWIYGHLCNYLPAAPRIEMAEVLLRHTIFDAPPLIIQRRAADMLVWGQPAAVVERWIEKYLSPEALYMAALLAQTLTLRGRDTSAASWATRLRQALQQAGHPLGTLPLFLHDIERSLPQRHYRYTFGTLGGESLARPGVGIHKPATFIETCAEPVRFTPLAPLDGLTAPFDLWTTASNGQLEAVAVALDAPIPQLTPRLLAGLGLSSVQSAKTVQLYPASVEEVFLNLYLGGLAGGAYGGELYSAEARLAAWRSLGALVGLAFNGDLESVAEPGRCCQLALYADPGSNFFSEIFDFAVACLRSDGQSLAVLAVTDTD